MQLRLRSFAFVVLALTLSLAAPYAQTPAAPKVTSPKTFFGHDIGADYVLPNYTKFTEYVKKLDAESDRMIVQSIGKTAEGRDQLMAIITAPENFKKLDRYKEISRRLSQAEGLTDDAGAALAKEGKAVIWIDGGLHANEVLGAQQLIETIYQFVEQDRRRDAAHPARRDHPRRARQSRRHGAGLRLVHAQPEPEAAQHRRAAAALPEVRRPRQQPRLLHDEPAGVDRTSTASCIASGSRRSSTTITRPARPAR